MFALPTRHREDRWTVEFVHAMRAADPRYVEPAETTLELPRIVATNAARLGEDEPDEALVDRLPWWALALALVAALAPLVIMLGMDTAPATPHVDPATVQQLDRTEHTVDPLGGAR